MKYLYVATVLLLAGCGKRSTITVYTKGGQPVVVMQEFDILNIIVKSNRVAVDFVVASSMRGVQNTTNSVVVEDDDATIVEVKK